MTGDEVKEKASNGQPKSGRGVFVSARSTTKPSQDLISKKLREYYQEVAQQPVPDRFSELLDELERKSDRRKG